MKNFLSFLLLLFMMTSGTVLAQQPLEISIQADKPGAEIQPTMWGVFFEDINFAADGGIYAELVKNRSFEFELPLSGWSQTAKQNGTGRIVPGFYSPSNSGNPHFVSVYIDPAAGSFGLTNEYFLLAGDMGAEPLPILNCGMSCQFNAAEVVPLEELDTYIQDALDLIEFANGDPSTRWGGLRSEMGHPAKFNMKYLGIGNEQWDEQYIERYWVFKKVLKEKHPEIKIVSGSGPSSAGRMFEYGWSELRKLSPDLIDEHYYMPPEWFLENAARYDNYDRNGIKVFAGEYAAPGKEGTAAESRNTWWSALCEAAFMTGQNGIYASSSVDRKNGKLYIKPVNSSEKQVPVRLALGKLPYTKSAVRQTLKSENREDFNSVSGQELIIPSEIPVSITGRRIDTVSEPLSVNVIIIDFKVR